MDYINDLVGWKGKLIPDMYNCYRLDDFIDYRHTIKQPSGLGLKNILAEIGDPGDVLILVHNTDIKKIDSMKSNSYEMTNPNSGNKIIAPRHRELIIESDPLSEIDKEPGRYSVIFLLYYPKNDDIRFYGGKKTLEMSKKGFLESILDRNAALSYNNI